MSTVLHSNRYYKFHHQDSPAVLRLEWREATSEMSDPEFRDALSNFAGFAVDVRPANILVDVRAFRHAVAEGLGEWRDRAVIPRYNRAGVARFGYLVPPGQLPPNPAPPPSAVESFQTHFFDSERAIVEWFSES